MKLLFVCSGNTCRSPMAEAIARDLVRRRGLANIEVASAGAGAVAGTPASDGALLVALEQGLDLTAHRSQPLTRALVADTDLVLVMGPAHLERALALGGAGKAVLLTDFATRGASVEGISDPFGADLDVYRQTYVELTDAIAAALDRIIAEGRADGRAEGGAGGADDRPGAG